MAWIKSYQEIERHPKTLILMKEMNWPLDVAISKLHRLWWWCADYAWDGDLSKHDPDIISAAIGCPDMKGDFLIAALVKAGFVDTSPSLRLHDWWAHFGDFLRGRFARTPDKWQQIEACYAVASVAKVKQFGTCSPLNKEKKERKEKKYTTTAGAGGVEVVKPVNWDNCHNDIQRLLAYYVSIETPELYKTATQSQANGVFKRYGRAASELLAVAGDLPTAKRAFDLAMAHFNKKGLSWNLSTVAANCAEFVNQAIGEKQCH